MPTLVVVNGEVLDGDGPVLHLDNRAFHYGDGLFESIRAIGGKPLFLDAHWARLQAGLRVLQIERPERLDRELLEVHIKELLTRTGISSRRLRLTVFRESHGHYRPDSDRGGFVIEVSPWPHDTFVLNDHGFQVDIYPDMRKPVNALSIHKTLNCQYSIMSALWSKERGLDECLLQNERGNIIESSSGNLFIVSNGVLYTPALSDGCVAGVMRMQVINLAIAHGMKVYECSLNPQNLLAADELFFTNAIRGIQWAAAYRTKRYAHRQSQELVELLVAQAAT